MGMMGVGKTTVGKILAQRLGCESSDLDDLVSREDSEGRECGAILKTVGEPIFRGLEFRALSNWAKENGEGVSVISLGGGAVLHPGVRRFLLGGEFWVVWLKASPEVIAERLLKTHLESRPLLRKADSRQALMEGVSALCRDREEFYAATATMTFDTREYSAEQVVEELLLGLRGAEI